MKQECIGLAGMPVINQRLTVSLIFLFLLYCNKSLARKSAVSNLYV